MKVNQTKLLKINGRKFAFDTRHILLCEIDDVYEACIKCIQNDKPISILYDQFDEQKVMSAYNDISEYINVGIFFSDEEYQYPYSKESSIGCFSFPPEHRCNMACKYCFADHGKNYSGDITSFSRDTIEQSFNFIINKLYPDFKGYRIDFVSGGEPLLNFDVIKQTCLVRDKYQDMVGKPIDIFLATNATLLTEQHLEFLDKNNINIGISLDGTRRSNDAARLNADGESTYDRVLQSITMIKNSKTISRSLKNIWGLCVLHNRNYNLLENLRHYNSIGLKTVQMKVARLPKDHPLSITKENLDQLKEGYSELNKAILAELRNNEKTLISMILNDNDYYGKILRRLLARTPVIYRCGAGKNKVSICANGDVYPCDSFVGKEEFKLGNIFCEPDRSKFERFYRFSIYENPSCKKCWIRHLCGGDCYHNSYLANNTVEQPDEIICELNNHLAVLAMEVLIEVENNDSLRQYFDRVLHTRPSTY